MSRAISFVESFSGRVDEGLAGYKKKLRSCAKEYGETGTRGVRGMIEVALDQLEQFLDTQDESCPNPMSEEDMKVAKECCEKMKKLRNSIKALKEYSTGMYSDPEESKTK